MKKGVQIYQITPNVRKELKFIAFHTMCAEAGTNAIDPDIYHKVHEAEYEFDVGCVKDYLEEIFDLFNSDAIPDDYEGNALTVSDIIALIAEGGKKTYYFCDYTGFKRVAFAGKNIPK